MNKIKISACIITYNQDGFIRECLDGAINQKVSFEYEIVIGEDYSSDKTRQICEEYAIKYPNIIKFFPREKNLGMIGNWMATINNCKGKYIALCEGDDYWTDPLKLQKQVDFLEMNPSYSYCGHRSMNLINDVLSPIEMNLTEITIEKLIEKNWVSTAALVFKKSSIENLPALFKNAPAGDWLLQFIALKSGNGYVLEDNMSVYRKHENGVWSGLDVVEMCERGIVTLKLVRILFNEKKINELIDIAILERRRKFGLGSKSYITRIKKKIEKYFNRS